MTQTLSNTKGATALRRFVALGLVAVSTATLSAESLSLGEAVTATLESDSITYEVAVTAGESVLIEGQSSTFDLHLDFTGPSGAKQSDFARNEVLQPLMIVTPTETGTATLAVTSATDEKGDFTIETSVHTPQMLTANESVDLTLGGASVHLAVESSATHHLLKVEGDSSGVYFARIVDSAGKLLLGQLMVNSQSSEMIIDDLAPGKTFFTLLPLRAPESQAVSLTLSPMEPSETLEFTGAEDASLTQGGLMLEPGDMTHTVRIDVAEATGFQVEVSSDAFSPRVMLITPDDTKVGSGDSSATLAAQLGEPGELLLVVRPMEEGQGGEFSVKMSTIVAGAMPVFNLVDTAGNQVSSADFEGDILVVDFWATWCGPCVRAMPHLSEVSREHAEEGVKVIGISSDDPDDLRDFIAEHSTPFPTLLDGNRAMSSAFGALTDEGQIRGIPTTFVFGRDGKLVEYMVGYGGPGPLDSALERALAQ